MFESIILGAVQGIAEWLPISSEAMVILVKNNFFPSGMDFSALISFAIFLHLGTLLSVVVWYRKRLWKLLGNFFSYRSLGSDDKQEISFIVIATLVSGVLGYFLLNLIDHYQDLFSNEHAINTIVACFLLFTAFLLYITERKGQTEKRSLNIRRAGITGLFQAFAAIPGISRSGSTIAGMGLLGIDKERALELSFILSVPLVLGANIVLHIADLQSFSGEHLIALLSAFVFGTLSIKGLLKLVKVVRFSSFVGIFALLLLIVSFLS